MQLQILEYICKHLFPNLCGYREGHFTQIALTSMLKKWKLSLDNKDFSGGVLMDLSNTFDIMNHKLSLVKLNAY